MQTDQIYWRLHGRGGYSYRYSDQDLQQLQTMFRQHALQSKDTAFVLFNNIWMKDDARRFQLLNSEL